MSLIDENAKQIGETTYMSFRFHPNFFNEIVRVAYFWEQRHYWVGQIFDCLIMDDKPMPEQYRRAFLRGDLTAEQDESGNVFFNNIKDEKWKTELKKFKEEKDNGSRLIAGRWVSNNVLDSFASFEYKYRRWAEDGGYLERRTDRGGNVGGLVYLMNNIRNGLINRVLESAGLDNQLERDNADIPEFTRAFISIVDDFGWLSHVPHADLSRFTFDQNEFIRGKLSDDLGRVMDDYRQEEKTAKRIFWEQQEYKKIDLPETAIMKKGEALHDRYLVLHENHYPAEDPRFIALNKQCLSVFKQIEWNEAVEYTNTVLDKGERASWSDLNQIRYYIHLVELGIGHFSYHDFSIPIEVLGRIYGVDEETILKNQKLGKEAKREIEGEITLKNAFKYYEQWKEKKEQPGYNSYLWYAYMTLEDAKDNISVFDYNNLHNLISNSIRNVLEDYVDNEIIVKGVRAKWGDTEAEKMDEYLKRKRGKPT